MTNLAIHTRDLHKTYVVSEREGGVAAALRGLIRRHTKKIPAVGGISFDLMPGEIVGFLGPNGAGKTTTLRVISTLLAPSAGTVRVDGIDAGRQPQEVRARIGTLSDARGLYGRLTARENIAYYGELRGLPRERIAQSIGRLAALLEFDALLDRRTEGFSQGEASCARRCAPPSPCPGPCRRWSRPGMFSSTARCSGASPHVMRAWHLGSVVGVDVTRARGVDPAVIEGPPSWTNWLLSGDWRRGPPIVSVLMQAATITSAAEIAMARAATDLLIIPEPEGVEIRDWKAYEPAVAAGYEATKAALAQLSGPVSELRKRHIALRPDEPVVSFERAVTKSRGKGKRVVPSGRCWKTPERRRR